MAGGPVLLIPEMGENLAHAHTCTDAHTCLLTSADVSVYAWALTI